MSRPLSSTLKTAALRMHTTQQHPSSDSYRLVLRLRYIYAHTSRLQLHIPPTLGPLTICSTPTASLVYMRQTITLAVTTIISYYDSHTHTWTFTTCEYTIPPSLTQLTTCSSPTVSLHPPSPSPISALKTEHSRSRFLSFL